MPVPCKLSFWENVCDKHQPCSCPLTPLRDGHVQVGSLSLRFWPVDHSIPGAGAFGINTTGGWVIYTGDLLVTPGRKNFWRSSNHPPPPPPSPRAYRRVQVLRGALRDQHGHPFGPTSGERFLAGVNGQDGLGAAGRSP